MSRQHDLVCSDVPATARHVFDVCERLENAQVSTQAPELERIRRRESQPKILVFLRETALESVQHVDGGAVYMPEGGVARAEDGEDELRFGVHGDVAQPCEVGTVAVRTRGEPDAVDPALHVRLQPCIRIW